MKHLTYLIVLVLALQICGNKSFAQNFDCSGGRYQDSLFEVTITPNVLYGSNLNYAGAQTNLYMNIYTPTGDNLDKRPLIIFAPKGSFLQQDRNEKTMVQLCTRFAQKGYVTAAIDYIVVVNYAATYLNPQKEFTYAVLRASHDYKAAIRFFRKDAATTNIYKIDPEMSIAGGSSAGAITAVHVAYLDTVSEMPTVIDTAGLGGAEGLSGNIGYSSKVNYVVNLCGAIADTNWITANNIPLISMHGNLDTEVPYGTATISMGIPIMAVDGSASINLRAQHLGIENPFYTFWGQQHIPYDENAAGSYELYMDTVVNFVKTHLHNWICSLSSINEIRATQPSLLISPNPANDFIYIQADNFNKLSKIEIIDYCGRIIYTETISQSEKKYKKNIPLSNYKKGFYLIKATSQDLIKIQKMIIN